MQAQKSDSEPQQVPQKQQYKVQKLPPLRKITPALIMRTSIQHQDYSKLNQEQKIQMLLNIQSIHLQWQNIETIQNLEVYTKVTILYLQHNRIRKIEGLETLVNLQYLSLNNNLIEKVQGLNNLPNLYGLNLSHNKIQQINGNQFPNKIQLLSLAENPCAYDAKYKQVLVQKLKFLDSLDGQKLDSETKFKLLGLFPNKLSKYAQSMKKFRQSKEQKQLKQQIFIGRGMIDEDQIVKTLRAKTLQILDQSKKDTQKKQIEQIQNFKQKIKVSKNLQKIRQNAKSMKSIPEQQQNQQPSN